MVFSRVVKKLSLGVRATTHCWRAYLNLGYTSVEGQARPLSVHATRYLTAVLSRLVKELFFHERLVKKPWFYHENIVKEGFFTSLS
jgi:hypothetical protein